jgi:hypothetical protein
MNSATALHTRAPCDECGEMPATREGPGGSIVCDGCGAAKPANDDALGALLGAIIRARPLCSICQIRPALLRTSAGTVCSECSSFPAPSSSSAGEYVTVAEKSPPDQAAAVTTNSRNGASISSDITKGDRHETLARSQLSEPFGAAAAHGVVVPGSREPVADVGNTKQMAGLPDTRSARHVSASGPQDSIATGDSNRPSDVQGLAVVGRDAVPGNWDRQTVADALTHGLEFSAAVDPELDSLVANLERGWLQSASFPEPVFVGIDLASAKYVATSASFAANDSASNDISKSEAAGA